MLRSKFKRVVGAPLLLLSCVPALGQEALPSIDIGASQISGPAQRPVPGDRQDKAAYKTWNTSTATKTDSPIMQTPVSVQVVPQQILQDQQVVIIDKALQNVSGVYMIPVGGLQAGFSIRGFETYKYYLDGVRVDNRTTPGSRDTVDLDRIEVLKGPASVLFGRLEPGGLINLATKRPSEIPSYAIQQQFGSFDFYRTALNMTGPVTDDKRLLYRFDAAYQNSSGFRDFADVEHVFLAPRLHFEPNADTQANLYLQYFHSKDPIYFGFPKFWGSPYSALISRSYGEPNSEEDTHYDVRVGFDWSHSFDANWKITHRFDADFRDAAAPGTVVVNGVTQSQCTWISCPIARSVNRFVLQGQYYFTNIDLTGKFDTFGVEHELLVGGDYYADLVTTQRRSQSTGVPSIDLFNPVHTGSLGYLLDFASSVSNLRAEQDYYGLYVQDQAELPFGFHLLAGFRYDNAHAKDHTDTFSPTPAIAEIEVRQQAIKPRVGLLWRPIPELSLYGNYVENFSPPSTTGGPSSSGPNQPALKASEGSQWEAGVKTELFEGRLTTTVSWFDITKTNVATPDPDPARAALGYRVLTGAVRNRGWEADVSGQLLDELKLIANIAYIDSNILKDNSGNVGHRLYGVPKFAGGVWAVYEPRWTLVPGLSFGAGLVSSGAVWADTANTLMLPGYTIANLMARYAFEFEGKKISFQINADNITDVRYYAAAGGANSINPAQPRNIMGAIRVEF
ncbi:ferrichrome-iron receptor [Methylosinus sp. C49]|uniref:TonB-dependent siderophore receptor n=1 Tax=Methylosinus sp. C49 TaxID=2699395 RepID=UPI0013670757|nr:TonB-dependent siderophore receptor [Methylosinus sp. C49]BBU60467.1 ferrichrome-iron receptor [Methylosinus sp. C49]